MQPAFKALLWAVVFFDVYVLVCYRLLVKHHYQQAHGVSEGIFSVPWCFPPYTRLPVAGRKYARRYWVALGILVGCVIALAVAADFSRLDV